MSDTTSAEEQAAARAQEEAEEEQHERETIGSDTLPDVRSAYVNTTGRVVREWVRAAVVIPAVKRLYDIGMGVARFEVPTGDGVVKRLPAPAAVQTKALATLVSIGIPAQVGLVDDDGHTLPGVFALGALELDAARQLAHGERYMAATASPLPPMAERVMRGEFEMVEVEEGVGAERSGEDVAPGPIPPPPETMEQRILRERRARKAATNGHTPNGNGKHA